MSLAEILNEAELDEFKARDTCRRIIDAYGPVKPFANLVEAEQHHSDRLRPPFRRDGIAVPEFPDPARISMPGSPPETCQAAVRTEIDNAAMYDRLLVETALGKVRTVFLRPQVASRDHHRSVFWRCAEHSSAADIASVPGGGCGRGDAGRHGPGFGFGTGRGAPR